MGDWVLFGRLHLSYLFYGTLTIIAVDVEPVSKSHAKILRKLKKIKVQFKDGNCDHVYSCLSKKLTDAKISQVRVTLIEQLV